MFLNFMNYVQNLKVVYRFESLSLKQVVGFKSCPLYCVCTQYSGLGGECWSHHSTLFEWYVVWWVAPTMEIKKKKILKAIGLPAQNMITTMSSISSIVNIMRGEGDVYDHLMSSRIFTLLLIRYIHMIWICEQSCRH